MSESANKQKTMGNVAAIMDEMGDKARIVAASLAQASAETKNAALAAMAGGVRADITRILEANARDMEAAK